MRDEEKSHDHSQWLRSKPTATSILLGASNSEQLKANVEVVDVTLAEEHL